MELKRNYKHNLLWPTSLFSINAWCFDRPRTVCNAFL